MLGVNGLSALPSALIRAAQDLLHREARNAPSPSANLHKQANSHPAERHVCSRRKAGLENARFGWTRPCAGALMNDGMQPLLIQYGRIRAVHSRRSTFMHSGGPCQVLLTDLQQSP